jgi:hypothetical protein
MPIPIQCPVKSFMNIPTGTLSLRDAVLTFLREKARMPRREKRAHPKGRG